MSDGFHSRLGFFLKGSPLSAQGGPAVLTALVSFTLSLDLPGAEAGNGIPIEIPGISWPTLVETEVQLGPYLNRHQQNL